MCPAKEKPTFETSLERLGAKKAFDTLVGDGVAPRLLRSWLWTIMVSPDDYQTRNNRRGEALQLARRARALASRIERASQPPALPLVATAPEIEEMVELPRRLRKYARVWEKNLSMRIPRGASQQSETIVGLLDIVKTSTGRCHYEEVADLLNGISRRKKHGRMRWDVTNLKQLHYRAKKRMAKALKGFSDGRR